MTPFHERWLASLSLDAIAEQSLFGLSESSVVCGNRFQTPHDDLEFGLMMMAGCTVLVVPQCTEARV